MIMEVLLSIALLSLMEMSLFCQDCFGRAHFNKQRYVQL